MKVIITALFTVAAFSVAFAQQRTIILFGNTDLMPPSEFVLSSAFEDARLSDKSFMVNEDGTFQYTLSVTDTLAWMLIKKDEMDAGAYKPVYFFSDADTVYFDISNMASDVSGRGLTDEYYTFVSEMTAQIQEVQEQIGGKLSGETNQDSVRQIMVNNIIIAVTSGLTKRSVESPDLLSYYLLLEFYQRDNYRSSKYSDELLTALKELSVIHPDHPYSERLKYVSPQLEGMSIGKAYHEITIDNMKDSEESVSLSSVISANSYTLLDLWAPWCGPCIRKSQNIRPHYDELKEKGFGVFSFMGGLKDSDVYERNQSKYNYPWDVYFDLNQQEKIWLKYGVGNSGGGQFLIDNKGMIVAIDPSVEEIEQFLGE